MADWRVSKKDGPNRYLRGVLKAKVEGKRVYGWIGYDKLSTNRYHGDPLKYAITIAGHYQTGTFTYSTGLQSGVQIYTDYWTQAEPGDYRVSGWIEEWDNTAFEIPSMIVSIPEEFPPKATNLSCTTLSDSSMRISFDIPGASKWSPARSITLWRTSNRESGWKIVHSFDTRTAPVTKLAFDDTGLQDGTVYTYQVLISNKAGRSESAMVDYYTRPLPPVAVSLSKTSASEALITYTPASGMYTKCNYMMEVQYDSGPWEPLGGVSSSMQEYSFPLKSGVTNVQVRVQSVCYATLSNSVHKPSDWKLSNIVGLLRQPLAPTPTYPNGHNVLRQPDKKLKFTWVFNSVDSSPQEKFQLEVYKEKSEDKLFGSDVVSSPTPAYEMSTPTDQLVAGVYRWRVKAKGAHDEYSPWSNFVLFTMVDPPQVKITSPTSGGVINTSELTLDWTYAHPQDTNPASYEITIQSSTGEDLHHVSKTCTPTDRTFTETLRYQLKNNTDYKVVLKVTDVKGFSTTVSSDFRTQFATPMEPVFTPVWNPNTGSVTISVTNPPDTLTIVANYVYRIVDNKPELLGKIPPNGTLIDGTVPLNKKVTYEVLAVSSLPSSKEAYRDVFTEALTQAYWTHGSSTFKIYMNHKKPPKMDLKIKRRESKRYVFAGRIYAVEYAGKSFLRDGSVEFLIHGLDTKYMVESMSMLEAPHFFRFPDQSVWATILSCDMDRIDNEWYTVKLAIEEVEASVYRGELPPS